MLPIDAGGVFHNGHDWLAIRYKRHGKQHRAVGIPQRHPAAGEVRRAKKKWMLDAAAWHELKMSVDGVQFNAFIDGEPALDYTLGSEPGPGRNGAPPNADLIPANNPVLRPPVSGKVGLWSKTDSTSYFKDYVVTAK